MDALFKQTLVRTDIERFRHWIPLHQLAVIGVSPDGVVEYDQVRYTEERSEAFVLILVVVQRSVTSLDGNWHTEGDSLLAFLLLSDRGSSILGRC